MRARDVLCAVAVAILLAFCMSAQASIVIDTVTVGNPGNAGELSGKGAGGSGPDAIVGGVNYAYNIGKYEVTAGQYTEFLNAVAATDTYALYNGSMWSGGNLYPCGIQRTGSPGSYAYGVASDWANRPVNYVSFWDAVRYANWNHNGRPMGTQGPATTEDGSYTLNGYLGPDGSWIMRNPGATWVVPSEDEWYKAAYHKNDGATGNYWDYPTGTDDAPSNDLVNPDPGNNANFYDGDYTIGDPYYRTEVGEFENSESPYGTFDQGGNIREWNEALITGSYRGLRGGSFGFPGPASHLESSWRIDSIYPTYEDQYIGFRVAEVPEPATLALFILGTMALGRRKRVELPERAYACALLKDSQHARHMRRRIRRWKPASALRFAHEECRHDMSAGQNGGYCSSPDGPRSSSSFSKTPSIYSWSSSDMAKVWRYSSASASTTYSTSP